MFNSDGSYNKQECKACMTGTQCSETNSLADKALCNLGCDFVPEVVETVMGTNGQDYRGKQTKTKSGLTCQAWNVDIPNNRGSITPTAFPQADLSKNYCRNPDNRTGGIWCFTTDLNTPFEQCDSINGDNDKLIRKCNGQDFETCGSDPQCKAYAGNQTKTRSGKTCQAWNVNTPHQVPTAALRALPGNKCRNPNNKGHPWCYTTDKFTEWEYCDPIGTVTGPIAKCEDTCTDCNVLTDSKCTPMAEPAPSDGLHIASSSKPFAPLAFNNVHDYRMKADAPENTYLCGVKIGSFNWNANGVS
jgi:hypothetical protein